MVKLYAPLLTIMLATAFLSLPSHGRSGPGRIGVRVFLTGREHDLDQKISGREDARDSLNYDSDDLEARGGRVTNLNLSKRYLSRKTLGFYLNGKPFNLFRQAKTHYHKNLQKISENVQGAWNTPVRKKAKHPTRSQYPRGLEDDDELLRRDFEAEIEELFGRELEYDGFMVERDAFDDLD